MRISIFRAVDGPSSRETNFFWRGILIPILKLSFFFLNRLETRAVVNSFQTKKKEKKNVISFKLNAPRRRP